MSIFSSIGICEHNCNTVYQFIHTSNVLMSTIYRVMRFQAWIHFSCYYSGLLKKLMTDIRCKTVLFYENNKITVMFKQQTNKQ